MTETTTATTKPVKTKEERIAALREQIVKINARIVAIENGTEGKGGKIVYIPSVGDKVLATVGRNTATSQARVVEGVVLAVKVPAEGEKGAVQVRVQFGEGFDAQIATLYAAQVEAVKADPEAADDTEYSNAPLGTLGQ